MCRILCILLIMIHTKSDKPTHTASHFHGNLTFLFNYIDFIPLSLSYYLNSNPIWVHKFKKTSICIAPLMTCVTEHGLNYYKHSLTQISTFFFNSHFFCSPYRHRQFIKSWKRERKKMKHCQLQHKLRYKKAPPLKLMKRNEKGGNKYTIGWKR